MVPQFPRFCVGDEIVFQVRVKGIMGKETGIISAVIHKNDGKYSYNISDEKGNDLKSNVKELELESK
jgi:hypothetical protein